MALGGFVDIIRRFLSLFMVFSRRFADGGLITITLLSAAQKRITCIFYSGSVLQ